MDHRGVARTAQRIGTGRIARKEIDPTADAPAAAAVVVVAVVAGGVTRDVLEMHTHTHTHTC